MDSAPASTISQRVEVMNQPFCLCCPGAIQTRESSRVRPLPRIDGWDMPNQAKRSNGQYCRPSKAYYDGPKPRISRRCHARAESSLQLRTTHRQVRWQAGAGFDLPLSGLPTAHGKRFWRTGAIQEGRHQGDFGALDAVCQDWG